MAEVGSRLARCLGIVIPTHVAMGLRHGWGTRAAAYTHVSEERHGYTLLG
jgi:hypothetical protein